MAYLAIGQYTAMKEHGRLVEEVKSLHPKPRRDASDKEWARWSMSQNQAHEMSEDRLRQVIQAELVKNARVPPSRWHNFVTCPRCRGYRLERQWCEQCSGKGLVECARRDFAYEILKLIRAGQHNEQSAKQ